MKTLLSAFLFLVFAQLITAQDSPFQTGHTNDILEVKFSPDDTQLISYSAGDGCLCLWDVRSGRLLWTTRTEFVQKGVEYYNLKEFYWSEGGNFVVTKSMNETFQKWDARTGKILSLSVAKPNVKLISPNKKPVSSLRKTTKSVLLTQRKESYW